jgi:hypothetical protein
MLSIKRHIIYIHRNISLVSRWCMILVMLSKWSLQKGYLCKPSIDGKTNHLPIAGRFWRLASLIRIGYSVCDIVVQRCRQIRPAEPQRLILL